MAQALWENDWARVRIALGCFALYGALQLVAVGRYPETVNWGTPQAWLYAAFPLGLLVVGVLGLLSARRAVPAQQVAAPVTETRA